MLQFTRDLGFSETLYGLGGGMFFLGYLLLEIPSNSLCARLHDERNRVLPVGEQNVFDKGARLRP